MRVELRAWSRDATYLTLVVDVDTRVAPSVVKVGGLGVTAAGVAVFGWLGFGALLDARTSSSSTSTSSRPSTVYRPRLAVTYMDGARQRVAQGFGTDSLLSGARAAFAQRSIEPTRSARPYRARSILATRVARTWSGVPALRTCSRSSLCHSSCSASGDSDGSGEPTRQRTPSRHQTHPDV